MYKLVAVAGKIRGQEFELSEGENIAGRDSGCDLYIPIGGVSKKHFSITVTGDTCYLKDLGSSNGTFVNGKVITRATVSNEDKIALPDTILQVVYVEEKKVIIKKRVIAEDEEDEEEFIHGGRVPDAPIQKALWFIKYRFMKPIHGFNEEYEWGHLLPILLVLFCLTSVSFIVFPLMDSNKTLLIGEIAQRGKHYIKELARLNTQALNNREIEKIDTEWIMRKGEGVEGVTGYRLMDMEGRIVRPTEKLNEYVSDPFFVSSLERAQIEKDKNKVFVKGVGKNSIGISQSIWAFNQNTAQEEPIGIVAIKFSPSSLNIHSSKVNLHFLESFVKITGIGLLLYGIFYFLTLRPIEELRYQIEEGLRGGRKNVESRYLFSELTTLKNSINTALQRIRELNKEDGDELVEEEGDESYVSSLNEFLQGAQGPAFVLDSHKNLSYINMEAEDLCGIRESSSQGMNLLDVSREQGFAATVIELCDNSANNNGTHQQGEYELGGIPYNVNVTSLIGRDSFAKAFYVTFSRDE